MTIPGKSPILVGLTGGIGAGKSTVAALIRRSHPVIDTDRIAREIMEGDAAVRAALSRRFGDAIYLEDGSLDRAALAATAFADERRLAELNGIVHPPVMQRIREEADTLHRDGHRVVFVESALIFEAGIEDTFDYTVAVVSDTEQAIERVMQRDGATREAVAQRLRHQLPPEDKARLADFTIRNNGTLEDLQRATFAIVMIVSRLGTRLPS